MAPRTGELCTGMAPMADWRDVLPPGFRAEEEARSHFPKVSTFHFPMMSTSEIRSRRRMPASSGENPCFFRNISTKIATQLGRTSKQNCIFGILIRKLVHKCSRLTSGRRSRPSLWPHRLGHTLDTLDVFPNKYF